MKKKYTPEIDRTLVLSTAHISLKLSRYITKVRLVVYGYEYGWIIHVPPSDHMKNGVSRWVSYELKPMFALCRKLKCKWLRLDRDGNTNPNFKTYVW